MYYPTSGITIEVKTKKNSGNCKIYPKRSTYGKNGSRDTRRPKTSDCKAANKWYTIFRVRFSKIESEILVLWILILRITGRELATKKIGQYWS